MSADREIIARVRAAREKPQLADELIRDYIPFIRAEASRFLRRPCTEQDDEFSIAMIAFHEAVENYSHTRGAFLRYAALTIRSRLIDYRRKEARHQGHLSLDGQTDAEDAPSLHETLADPDNPYENSAVERSAALAAARSEIAELAAVMETFGISYADVAANTPRQSRTREACGSVVRYASAHREILDELLANKKLPLAKLAAGTGLDRKTLERHRKYILVMLLVQTNGYEIIWGHLRHVLTRRADS